MDLGLNGKITVVCGGSRGLGRAIALGLAKEKASLVLIARDAGQLQKTAEEIKKVGAASVKTFPFDLSATEQIPGLVQKILKEVKTVHILVNNAGGPVPGTLSEVKDSDWQKAIDQNLKSVIVMTREIIPVMKKGGFGRILNITSQFVKEPPPHMILSNTTRAGVTAFAKSISHELAAFNITVNNLCPNTIATDRLESLLEKWAKDSAQNTQDFKTEFLKSIPAKRLGKPEELADAALFLVSERAGYITGVSLSVDGGATKSPL